MGRAGRQVARPPFRSLTTIASLASRTPVPHRSAPTPNNGHAHAGPSARLKRSLRLLHRAPVAAAADGVPHALVPGRKNGASN
eukprot:12708883-Alexandrium_andersonii.AAC.1